LEPIRKISYTDFGQFTHLFSKFRDQVLHNSEMRKYALQLGGEKPLKA
jgi:hypothetical protein